MLFDIEIYYTARPARLIGSVNIHTLSLSSLFLKSNQTVTVTQCFCSSISSNNTTCQHKSISEGPCMSPHVIVGPPGPKFTQFGKKGSISQIPDHAKFHHPVTKSVRYICCQKFVLHKKWTKVHQNPLGFGTQQYPKRCKIWLRSDKKVGDIRC